MKEKHSAKKILVAHTADDQVETVLMRILEGAGISGLKGIPRRTKDGVERPLLDTWREEIVEYLRGRKIPYRVDKSNFDIRFERNWIRSVLLPLLENRYGNSVRKRLFALGERFREIDLFIERAARRWVKRNVRDLPDAPVGEIVSGDRRGKTGIGAAAAEGRPSGAVFRRKTFAKLPSVARKKVLQILCFERFGTAPNERLLEAMDGTIVSGNPSDRLDLGKGTVLRCRYEEIVLQAVRGKSSGRYGAATDRATATGVEKGDGGSAVLMDHGIGEVREEGRYPFGGPVPMTLFFEYGGMLSPGRMRRLVAEEKAAVFDARTVRLPLSVRPLRAGDRVRPYGLGAGKKVKEILIDRKIPREERWGRPAVCDADGRILWIPGIVRSDHAPVTPGTRRTCLLRILDDRNGNGG